MATSRSRSRLVARYLEKHFHLSAKNIGVMPLNAAAPNHPARIPGMGLVLCFLAAPNEFGVSTEWQRPWQDRGRLSTAQKKATRPRLTLAPPLSTLLPASRQSPHHHTYSLWCGCCVSHQLLLYGKFGSRCVHPPRQNIQAQGVKSYCSGARVQASIMAWVVPFSISRTTLETIRANCCCALKSLFTVSFRLIEVDSLAISFARIAKYEK
jgi:hypothetical protein